MSSNDDEKTSMDMYPRLAGKTVLITGASAGIGEATAHHFAYCQSNLILVARNIDKLNALKATLTTKYPNIKVHVGKVDVSENKNVTDFFAAIPEEFQDIDILVNNAGAAFGMGKVYETSEAHTRSMFAINVEGVVNFLRAVIPGMIKKNKGDVVNVSSVAGLETYIGGGIYAATKHAIEAITETLRKETMETNIRVISINPGLVQTSFSVTRFNGDQDKADNVYKGFEPLTGADIADNIVYTVSRKPHVTCCHLLVFPVAQAQVDRVYRAK